MLLSLLPWMLLVMAANLYDTTKLKEAKQYALNRIGLEAFKPEQDRAIDACLNNFDTFISLPTGFGKSVVFQCVPLCHDFLRTHPMNTKDRSLAIVILPLKALAVDQVKRAEDLGMEAALMVAEISDEVMEQACGGHYSLLFTSPEVLLGDKGKELLQSPGVYSRLCGLFVDESHCVVKWGQSSGVTGAFREFYGMLSELRSVMKLSTPVTALTATATLAIRTKITAALGMQNTILIAKNPVNQNIKHVVVKTKLPDSETIFKCLSEELLDKEELTDRVIVYCQSRKDCSNLYSIFKSKLPPHLHKHFNMYHTNTENDIQQEICDDFRVSDGCVRVLFATIAFGLGVDVKGVNQVVLFKPPQELDDYVQLSGRGGRDGRQSLTVVIKTKSTGRPLSSDMRGFINASECRRDVLISAFPGDTSGIVTEPIQLHNCCDNCSLKCSCSGVEQCLNKLSNLEEQLAKLSLPPDQELPVVSVTPEVCESIKQEIFQLKNQQLQSLPSEHVYGGSDIASNIPTSTVNIIVANLHLALTYPQFCQRYALPNLDIAKQIWSIIVKHLGQKLQAATAMLPSDDESSSEGDDGDEEGSAGAEYQRPLVHSSDSD